MEYEKFEKDDLLRLQVDMLTSSTENNPDMIYDNSSLYNMALNPDYFKGTQTSIINAINLTYRKSLIANNSVEKFGNKFNDILLDSESKAGNIMWTNLKKEMGKDSIIEGLLDLYQDKLPTYLEKEYYENNVATINELIELYITTPPNSEVI